MSGNLTAARSLARSALRKLALFAIAAAVVLTVAVAAALGRSVSQMTLALSPTKPAPNSLAVVTVRGVADETAAPAVIAVSGSSCPARLPSVNRAFWSSDSTLALGPFTRKVSVFTLANTQRLCAYLQPGVDVNGDLQISPGAPLARAEIALSQAAASPIRGVPVYGVSGGNRNGPGPTLVLDRTGRKIVMVRTTCGRSSPMDTPSLGKEFIGKRFSARVSLPLTKTIHWSGLVTPDNSHNYDAPVPVAWTKPTRFTLNVTVIVKNGLARALVGTGALSSPGLPCPMVQHYVFP
jgi:hypothetical protein